MRIQIDTSLKTIKLDKNTKMETLIDFLDKIIPDEWMQYTIETNTIINWTNPIVYREPYQKYPNYWYDTSTGFLKNPTAHIGNYSDKTLTRTYSQTKGVYDLELETN